MIESDILKALQTAVLAAVAASTIPGANAAAKQARVKVVGRTFVPPTDNKWLEIIYIPNNVTGEFWDTGKTYRGLLRVLVHYPVDDQGGYEGLKVAESIAGNLAKGSVFSSGAAKVKIYDEPNLLNVLEMPPDLMFPVSIRYECFKA